jgi:hypothetical protein
MKQRPIPYVQQLTDRIGVPRHYYRHHDYRVTLPDPAGRAFELAYQKAAELDPYPRAVKVAKRDLERPTNVYLMHRGEHVKIGIALEPKSRLRTINGGAATRATLEATREFPARDLAKGVERDLHRLFQASRVNGEWFAIELADAKAALLAWPDPP